ncbi:MAG: M28 family peptidase [Chloroflexota bacterium]
MSMEQWMHRCKHSNKHSSDKHSSDKHSSDKQNSNTEYGLNRHKPLGKMPLTRKFAWIVLYMGFCLLFFLIGTSAPSAYTPQLYAHQENSHSHSKLPHSINITDIHTEIPSVMHSDTVIEPLLPQINEETLMALLQPLTGEASVTLQGLYHPIHHEATTTTLETRYTFADQIVDAETFLYQYYAERGLNVTYADWSYDFFGTTYTGRNVVAEIPGVLHPERIWVVGAHFDAQSELPRVNAPGADNNATGTAAVMLLAEILSELDFADTVRFVHFSASEQGQWGSSSYVQQLESDGNSTGDRTVLGYINLDAIGWDGDDDRVVDIHAGTDESSYKLAQLFAQINEDYRVELTTELYRFDANRESDHAAFWDAGYAAIWVTQNSTGPTQDVNPAIGSQADTIEKLNFDYMVGIARTTLATVAQLAGAQPAGSLQGSTSLPDVSAILNIPLLPDDLMPVVGGTDDVDDPVSSTIPAVETATPTATLAETSCENILINPHFEDPIVNDANNRSWEFGTTFYPAMRSDQQSYNGAWSLRMGVPSYTRNRFTHSSAWQRVTLPADWQYVIFKYWFYLDADYAEVENEEADVETGTDSETDTGTETETDTGTMDPIIVVGEDYRTVQVLNDEYRLLRTLEHSAITTRGAWAQRTFDLSDYRGQTVHLYFNVYNDGDDAQIWGYVDGVTLSSCQNVDVPDLPTPTPIPTTATPEEPVVVPPTATHTPTPTSTASSTATPTLTPTPTPTDTPLPPQQDIILPEPPLPTSEMTPTLRPSPTPIPSPQEGVDLVAHKLEITQGVQDLHNSVRLVAQKRTFIRFHAYSNSDDPESNAANGDRRNGTYWTTAHLTVIHEHDGVRTESVLAPINQGGAIAVRAKPNRDALDHAFLFELPTKYTEGNITLIGTLNPDQSINEVDADNNHANNTITTSHAFETVPPLTLVLVGIGYNDDIYPSEFHRNQLVNWLRMAYPISQINVIHRQDYWSAGLPTCGKLNAYLGAKRIWDIQNGLVPPDARYYALVDDREGFMRGCVDSSPAWVGSGPTGASFWTWWDIDGSYGDWYAGHELGHAYGILHANGCDATSRNSTHPHPNGRISTAKYGDDAVYGFNLETKQIYGPGWHDVMTYCPYMWNSDHSYTTLLDLFQDMPAMRTRHQQTMRSQPVRTDRLLITGAFNPKIERLEVETIFTIPDAIDPDLFVPQITHHEHDPDLDYDHDHVGETYFVVFRDAQGNELQRIPVTTQIAHAGPVPDELKGDHEEVLSRLNLVVPTVPGTTSIEFISADGESHSHHKRHAPTTITAGPAIPEVTLLYPNGNETFANEPVVVRWFAEDADDDPLTFNVEYSADNGEHWEMLTQFITTTSVEIPANNLTGSSQALFRVHASDGINSAHDQSDQPFTFLKPQPDIDINTLANQVVLENQTVALQGSAYNVEVGTVAADQVQWFSNIDGLLGEGEQLSTADLSVGEHNISFQAIDDAGNIVSDTIQIVVVDDAMTRTVENDLVAGPPALVIDPLNGENSKRVSVDNLNGGESLRWDLVVGQPWLKVSKRAGTTPDDFTITYGDISKLETGTHSTLVTIYSTDLPEEEIDIRVSIRIEVDETERAAMADALMVDMPDVLLDFTQPFPTETEANGEAAPIYMLTSDTTVIPNAAHRPQVVTVIAIDNQNVFQTIDWTATSNVPWIQLTNDAGSTDDTLRFVTDVNDLSDGTHSGIIQLYTPAAPNDLVEIDVVAVVPSVHYRFLPVVTR